MTHKIFRVAPSYFSFDELLCDNPLEAFQYQRMKEGQGLIIPPVIKRKEQEKVDDKENKDINKNVDVDEVFGFNEWEEQNEETPDSMRENMEKLEIEEKKVNSIREKVDSEIEDLFEYHVEETVPSLSQENTQEESPELKNEEEKEIDLELQKKNVSKIIAKYTDYKFQDEKSEPEEKEVDLELQKKNVAKIISKYTDHKVPDETSNCSEENKKEEMQVEVKKVETTSPQKTHERYPNVDTKQFSWFQRLMHDYEAAPASQVNPQDSQQEQQQQPAEPEEMEIQMYKEQEVEVHPQMESEPQRISESQQNYGEVPNMDNFWNELEDEEGLDEDKLIKEMKELDSSRNMDKVKIYIKSNF